MEESRFDHDVRGAIYRAFVEQGRAPVAAEIARMVSTTPARVEESFRRLHEDHLLVLAQGSSYIWMANPFSALPTPYTVTVGDKTFWGNCIWDALGVLALLRSDGNVSALCPDCGDELQVEIRDGDLVPAEHIVHFTVPALHWWDDIGFN